MLLNILSSVNTRHIIYQIIKVCQGTNTIQGWIFRIVPKYWIWKKVSFSELRKWFIFVANHWVCSNLISLFIGTLFPKMSSHWIFWGEWSSKPPLTFMTKAGMENISSSHWKTLSFAKGIISPFSGKKCPLSNAKLLLNYLLTGIVSEFWEKSYLAKDKFIDKGLCYVAISYLKAPIDFWCNACQWHR